MSNLFTLTLRDHALEAHLPSSHSLRWDIVRLYSLEDTRNNHRAAGAALGVVLAGVSTPWGKPPVLVRGGRLLDYGGQVIDWLMPKGIGATEIMAVGTEALVALSNSVAGDQMVQRAEDFTSSGGEPSTSNSDGSPDTTASPGKSS